MGRGDGLGGGGEQRGRLECYVHEKTEFIILQRVLPRFLIPSQVNN